MSENRQRLRPWLEAQINSGIIPGLHWLDEDHTLFRITWKHGGKPDWNEGDSLIFKLWAEHTGRYRAGIDKPDYATWKTRLRCAFNKAPDINQDKELSCSDAEPPYRVYRLLPKCEVKKKRISSTFNASDMDSDSSEDTGALAQMAPCSVPTVVSSMKIDSQTTLMSNDEWGDIKSDDLLKCDSLDQQKYISGEVSMISIQPAVSVGMAPWTPLTIVTTQEGQVTQAAQSDTPQDTEAVLMDEQSYPSDAETGAPLLMPPQQAAQQATIPQPQGHEMLVKLFFKRQQVAQYEMNNPNGSRLYYNSSNPGTEQNMAEVAQSFAMEMGEQVDQLFGPRAVSQYLMPPPYLCTDSQQESTNKILKCMERGLLLKCVDGDIYAARYCRCVIFCASPHKEDEIFKLERDNSDFKLFDFNNYFVPAVQKYLQGQGPRPNIEVRLGFGQAWYNQNWSEREIFISGSVVSAKALFVLQQLDQQYGPHIQISLSDDNDRIVETIKQLCSLKTPTRSTAMEVSA
ncbi:interferon regulatory factor 6 isoform X2 [Lingula anatina]|uniref:Interferon regulatory factor 6 isoform X2 n=1 Tax=Lingula anatina TaxID=7574 RepID=A0A1S3HBZ0_LINAN|nr:interferon regulatory factor 6 isoform X2 [Lingula anatina]|eukprot:XP_013382669.1 interferon regulatory factor 6 isoform X2 [Lingula anatina]